MLVFFAAAKHYGFYPTAGPMIPFRKTQSLRNLQRRYPVSPGSAYSVKLITEIVKWKVKDNFGVAKQKGKRLIFISKPIAS
jgi:hypothetical protein